MMSRTLQVLVTCCMEPSRTKVLRDVVQNMNEQYVNVGRELFVFDNASSDPETIDILKNLRCPIYRASRNVGYWSAIRWCLQSLPRSDFTYFIESDEMHYDYASLIECEDFLRDAEDVASVRLEEFSVGESHLYDKSRPIPESRRHAWTTLRHPLTGKNTVFSRATGRIYRTDLPPKLCGLNRRSMMEDVFDHLAQFPQISERDFQKRYYHHFEETALIDGGIFNVPTTYESLAGSYVTPEQAAATGYQPTRISKIVSDFDVKLIS